MQQRQHGLGSSESAGCDEKGKDDGALHVPHVDVRKQAATRTSHNLQRLQIALPLLRALRSLKELCVAHLLRDNGMERHRGISWHGLRTGIAAVSFLLALAPLLLAQYSRFDGDLDTSRLAANRLRLLVNGRGALPSNWSWQCGNWVEHAGAAPTTLVFDHGLSVLGLVKGELRGAFVQWGSDYGPGPIIDGLPAMTARPQDSLRYRPYRAYRSFPGLADYRQWPADLGAPVDAAGKPALLGDEIVWCVYNGLDSAAKRSDLDSHSYPRIPVEVRQAAYARLSSECDSVNALANTVFLEWTLLAKGSEPIDSAYVSFWTDIDVAELASIPAVDSAGQFAYCVEAYRSNGSAVGYVLLAGPAVPEPGSKALIRGTIRDGYRSLPLCGFHAIGDDRQRTPLYAQPYKPGEMWNTVRGLDINGQAVLNPVTGAPTNFPFDGDPSTGKGWVPDVRYFGGGDGFMMHAGPFTLAPGDTQWVMMALTATRGASTSESVRLLRARMAELRSMSYDSIQRGSWPRIGCPWDIGPVPPLPNRLQFTGPYPNPAGGICTFTLALPEDDYVQIDVRDLLGRRVALLVEEVRPAGTYNVLFPRGALASGLYICRLRTPRQDIDVKFLVTR